MANGIDRIVRLLSSRQSVNIQQQSAPRGEISGSRVLVGGRSYRRDPAVDMPLNDGDKVRVFIDGQTAVVIGK